MSPQKFYNKKGQMCGYLQNGIYRKKVDPKKHLLKIMDAYGIDAEIVNRLGFLETKEVRIMEIDSGNILSITFDDFIKHGATRNFDTLQTFVSRKFFTISERQSPLAI